MARRTAVPPLKPRKESDNEDLHLFRELLTRERERAAACLLLPVSDEFEHNNGNSSFYRVRSIKKESGFENGKNDYDWLKTPPATPLFPSVEMEAAAAHFILHNHIPPLSQSRLQASSNSEAIGRSSEIPKSTTTKQKIPSRSITPTHKPRFNSSTEHKNTKRTTTPTPNLRQTATQSPTDPIRNTIQSKNPNNNCTSNLSTYLSKGSANLNPRTRTTSPLVRSTIASQIPEFSDETPPNLRTKTDRSCSVTRGRQVHLSAAIGQKPEEMNPRRQSCSPSVMRGRKQENGGGNLRIEQRRGHGGIGTTKIVGSKMVEKLMNARKSKGNGEGESKPQTRTGISALVRTSRQMQMQMQMICRK